MNKKAQVNVNLVSTGVVTLVIVGIIFIMGLIILDELYLDTSDVAASFTNITTTGVSSSSTPVYITGYYDKCGLKNYAITSCINQSGNYGINSANWSVDTRTGAITYTGTVGSEGIDGALWNCTGSYTSGDGKEACYSANKSIEGVGKFGDYVDLIALAIVIAIVISLIIWGFGRKRLS